MADEKLAGAVVSGLYVCARNRDWVSRNGVVGSTEEITLTSSQDGQLQVLEITKPLREHANANFKFGQFVSVRAIVDGISKVLGVQFLT